MNILFACTSLLSDSSLIRDYDYINSSLKMYYPLGDMEFKKIKKDTYLIYKTMNITGENTLEIFNKFKNKRILESNGYNLIGNSSNKYVRNQDLYTFLKETPIEFDIIVFTQCNNLVETIISVEEPYDSHRVEVIIDSILNLYNSLTDSGFIFNFYYQGQDLDSVLCDIEDFYSDMSSEKLMYHIYIFECFSFLFERIDTGVYQKITKYDLDLPDKLYEIIDDQYNKLKEMFDEDKSKCIKYIIRKYFRNIVIKDSPYFVRILIKKFGEAIGV
jgi:hypothetical protein